MRKPAAVLAVLVAFLFCARHALPSYAAVQYAAGWNLVSGPEGSHLTGAGGPPLTLQPGDASYETFAADGALRAGWAYWAYFPNGGSLQTTPGLSTYTVTVPAGQWVMVGNP